MVKYENSKIYKIVDNTNGNIYVGSTVKTLSQRLGHHRATYKQFLAGKGGNMKSYDILKNGDYDIVLLEECKDITSKEQLHARERFYIDTLECVNKCRPGVFNELGKQEYNKQYKEQNKEYREQNKEKIKEKITCHHCNCQFRRDNKAHHERTKKHQANINKSTNADDNIITI